MLERVDSWVDGALRLLPNILVALVVLAVFYGLGLLARSADRASTRAFAGEPRRGAGSFVKWVVVLVGFMLPRPSCCPR